MPVTVRGWKRRESIASGALALAFATAAGVGKVTEAPSVTALGVAGAALTGLLTLFFVARVAKLEERQEKHELDGRLEVPVAPVSTVDPIHIGIARAREQTALAGGHLPTYVQRTVDSELQAKVDAATTSDNAWFIVLVGGPKIGKSRSLFEALRTHLIACKLSLVAPRNLEALRSIVVPGQEVIGPTTMAILWLGDLEPFLAQGLEIGDLRRWRAGVAGRIVVGTLGGKGGEISGLTTEKRMLDSAQIVLQNAEAIHMNKTNNTEVSSLLQSDLISAEEKLILESEGIGQWLVAVEQLKQKLMTGRQAERAIVIIAATWAHCGRTDPISLAVLRKLWDNYPALGVRCTDESFDGAVAWACSPVSDPIALVDETSDGLRALDLVVRMVTESPLSELPRDETWLAALEADSEPEVLAVARAADSQLKYEISIYGYQRVLERTTDPSVAAMAWLGMAMVFDHQGRHEEEIAAYDSLVERYEHSEDSDVRLQVATALFNKALAVRSKSESIAAIDSYDRVIAMFEEGSSKPLKELIAMATVNKAAELQTLEAFDSAVETLDTLIERFGSHGDFDIQIAVALTGKIEAISSRRRPEEVISICDELIERFSKSTVPYLRAQVADGMVYRGSALADLGRYPEAIAMYDLVINDFREGDNRYLRDAAVSAMVYRGVALEKQGSPDLAIAMWDEVIASFGEVAESSRPDAIRPSSSGDDGGSFVLGNTLFDKYGPDAMVRDRVALAKQEKGEALLLLDRPSDALAVFEAAINHAEQPDDLLRGHTALALTGKGQSLHLLGEHQLATAAFVDAMSIALDYEVAWVRKVVVFAAIQGALKLSALGDRKGEVTMYDLIIQDYGDDAAPGVREQVTSAMVNKAIELGDQGRHEEEIAAFDLVIQTYGDDTTPEVRQQVALAMVNKAIEVGNQGRHEEELALYDAVLQAYGDDTAPGVREQVASAMLSKSIELGDQGRHEEEIAVLDLVIEEYGEDLAPGVRAQVAAAMLNKAESFDALGRHDEELALYDLIIERYEEESSPEIQRQVAMAMLNKAAELFDQEANGPEISIYDDVLSRLDTAPDAPTRDLSAWALADKAEALVCQGNHDLATTTYELIVANFGEDRTPAVRKHVARAIGKRAVNLAATGRPSLATETYELLVNKFGEDRDSEIQDMIVTTGQEMDVERRKQR